MFARISKLIVAAAFLTCGAAFAEDHGAHAAKAKKVAKAGGKAAMEEAKKTEGYTMKKEEPKKEETKKEESHSH